ncbi:MAG: 2-phospho-L-lactate guanylyltransferase [Actinobacteria bacterium]|nr:2-phospho-L-lactate guanylyltransferase [Actinomycetota bacterium]
MTVEHPSTGASATDLPAYEVRATEVPATDAVVLVPIKAFHLAKGRLEPALDAASRERLARWTAERVLAAAGDGPVAVACDDHTVADWAREHGAIVLWQEGLGLNGAVDRAVEQLHDAGHRHVTVAHGDLPRPSRLAPFARRDTIVVVPDRRLDGTNVLSFPTAAALAGLRAAYGGGSFRRHLAAALATGLAVEVVRDPFLALDIDLPTDLTHPLVKDVLPAWLRTNPVNRSPIH